MVNLGFTTATAVAEVRHQLVKIGTGCKEFDNILGGMLGLYVEWVHAMHHN